MRRVFLGILIIVFILIQAISLSGIVSAASYNYVDAFAKSILYYEASWCGPDAGNNRLAWRGPCHTTDGADVGVDLTGGFHDAGDHVKFGMPQAYASSTLAWAYYEFKDTFVASGQDGYMLKILKHFTDYYLKCFPNSTTFYYQCGDGTTDHTYWGPPELQTTSRPTLYTATPSKPASDVCGSAAATLALMYLNYQDKDSAYATKCLTAAKGLYTFAKTYRGFSQSGGFYNATTDLDDLTWGAIWLYVATNDSAYMTDANNFMKEKGIDGNNTYTNHWTHCWDDVFGGVFVKMAQLTNDPKYVVIADENLNWWINSCPKTTAGECYINSWGALRYTAAECMLALVYYKTTQKAEYLNFAKQQMDYILGSNPRNGSYEVGFGTNYPKFPHHRAASGRFESAPAYETKKDPEKHLLYGALVGGPDINDVYTDDVEQYVYTEVAIDYNAGFVGAMAGMSKNYGAGQTAGSTPGIEDPSTEYYAEAKVLEEDTQHSTIGVIVHCSPLLPPHYVKGLSFRYFFDLTEFYNNGMSASDISAAINYAPNNGTLSGLGAWDTANHIYYIEGGWPSSELLYGKVEFQFRLANYSSKYWDPTNDYSRSGLTASAFTMSPRIVIYVNGVRVSGTEPPINGATPTPTRRGTPSPTARVTATPTPTQRIVVTATPTRRGTPSPTARATATPTPTVRRSATATPTPTRRGVVTATPTPTRRMTPSPTARVTNTPTPTVRSGGYLVNYTIQSDWGNGATISVTIINNTTTAVNGWTLAFTFSGNQTITNLWNGTYTQSGADLSVKDGGSNALIGANGGSVNFGFNISYSGTNAKPTSFTLNGTACQIQ